MATWGVVTMAKEPPELLAIFASFYAALGADEINIFLDGDDPEARRLLANVPCCRVKVIDDEFFLANWNCSYPANTYRRQRLAATKAYRDSKVDWMLFLDADEYLQADDFARELDELPPEIDILTILNGERVFSSEDATPSLFGGLMLTPKHARPYVIRGLFGEERLKYTDKGFCAHRFGKSATRTGKPYKLGVHTPRNWRENIKRHVSQRSVICHFDGITQSHWMLKLLRYMDMGTYGAASGSNQFRYEQIQFLKKSSSKRSIRELHDLIRKFDRATEARLRRHGLIDDVRVDPLLGLATYYPGNNFDLSVDWFDATLQAKMPDLYARLPD